MRAFGALFVALFLFGCDSAAKRHAAFMPRCADAGFTEKQCALLFAISEDSYDAQQSAAVAAGVGGFAIGSAAGTRK